MAKVTIEHEHRFQYDGEGGFYCVCPGCDERRGINDAIDALNKISSLEKALERTIARWQCVLLDEQICEPQSGENTILRRSKWQCALLDEQICERNTHASEEEE